MLSVLNNMYKGLNRQQRRRVQREAHKSMQQEMTRLAMKEQLARHRSNENARSSPYGRHLMVVLALLISVAIFLKVVHAFLKAVGTQYFPVVLLPFILYCNYPRHM